VGALHNGAAVVYGVEGRKLRNITGPYTRWINSRPSPP
jgi:hypothetical protein